MTTFCCRRAWAHAVVPGTFEAHVAALRAARPAVHVVPLVPHGALRLNVAGFAPRALTRPELDTPRAAWCARRWRRAPPACRPGWSTRPGSPRPRRSCARCARRSAPTAGCTPRTAATARPAIVDAAREAAAIAAGSGCRLQLSHFVRRPSSPADGGALERAAREHAVAVGERAGRRRRLRRLPVHVRADAARRRCCRRSSAPATRAEMAELLERLAAGPAAAGRAWRPCSRAGSARRCTSRPTAAADRFVGRTLAEVAARAARLDVTGGGVRAARRRRRGLLRRRRRRALGGATTTSTARCSTTASA